MQDTPANKSKEVEDTVFLEGRNTNRRSKLVDAISFPLDRGEKLDRALRIASGERLRVK